MSSEQLAIDTDLFAIAALEPDLIIASPRTQKFVDKFKEIANFVTTTNDEDGVAVAVEKFVLNKENQSCDMK